MNLLLSAPCPRLAGGIEAARVGTANTQRTAAPGNRYRTSRAVHQGGCYLASAGPTLVSAARFLTLGRDVSRWGPRYGAGVLFQIYFQVRTAVALPEIAETRLALLRLSATVVLCNMGRRSAALRGGYHSRGIATCGPASRNPWCRPMSYAACSSRAASRTRDSGPWRGGGFERRRKNTSPLRG